MVYFTVGLRLRESPALKCIKAAYIEIFVMFNVSQRRNSGERVLHSEFLQLSYIRALARLVSSGIDSRISIEVEALEHNPFEQSVQMRTFDLSVNMTLFG